MLKKRQLKQQTNILTAFIVLFFIAGCSSIFDARKQKRSLIELYDQGNYTEAVEWVKDKADDRAGTGDELMWRLEEGTLLFDNNQYEESLKIYSLAEKLIHDYDERAVISARDAGAEGAVLITNPNAIPYKGFNYDRILLNTYKALDYFALGDKDGAMVELRRMHERQKDAEERFEKEIEAEKQKIEKQNEKNQQKVSGTGSSKDSSLTFDYLLKNKQISASYNKTTKYSNNAYKNFVNPFSTYLSAIGYLSENNYTEAIVDFRNLYKMETNNPLIQRDLVSIAKSIGDAVPQPLKDLAPYDYSLSKNIVYVIFANGSAPALKQVKIQLILPYVGYCGFAYPEIEYFPRPYKNLVINADQNKHTTVTIADMKTIVSAEYHALLPIIITRIALSTLTKEISSAIAAEAARRAGGGGAQLATLLATGVYKYLMNTADTRCWQTLPEEYQIAHFPFPKNNTIQIQLGEMKKDILLNKNKNFTIIYVKSQKKAILSVKKFEFN